MHAIVSRKRQKQPSKTIPTTSEGTAPKVQENKLKLARVPLSVFFRKMQDYLTFKDDWMALVARELDKASQLYQKRNQIPG